MATFSLSDLNISQLGGNLSPEGMQTALNAIHGFNAKAASLQGPAAQQGNALMTEGALPGIGGNLASRDAAIGILTGQQRVMDIPCLSESQNAAINSGEPIQVSERNAKFDEILAKGASKQADSRSDELGSITPSHVARLEQSGKSSGRSV